MVIDTHTHVFPGEVIDARAYYAAADPVFGALYGSSKSRLAGVEELLASMDSAGVGHSIIAGIAWATPKMCVTANNYLFEAVSRFPERLTAFVSVIPGSAEAADEVERCAQAGARGIGELCPDTPGFDLAPVAATIEKYHLAVLLHVSEPVGHAYAGKGTATPDKALALIRRYPDITFICAHWGGGLPFFSLMPEVKTALGNTYFDSAASPFLYDKSIYHRVVDLIGADKILFGSDWPLIDQARALAEIDAIDMDDRYKYQIKHGNAAAILGIK